MALTASRHYHKTTITHNFSQKYRFKGSWDATEKLVKGRILNNELKYDHVANAMDCYRKLSRDLSKSGEDKNTTKLREYERKVDVNVVENPKLTTRRTRIGFAIKRKSQYEELSANSDYHHIMYTGHTNIPDMKPVNNTLKLSQVSGYIQPDPVSNHWRLSTAELPCSCPNCRLNPNNITGCSFREVRNMKKMLVKCLVEQDEANDPLGLHELTIAELKGELRLRGLTLGGRKAELIERLLGAFSAKYNDGNEGGDKANATVDGANPHPPHENPGAEDAL